MASKLFYLDWCEVRFELKLVTKLPRGSLVASLQVFATSNNDIWLAPYTHTNAVITLLSDNPSLPKAMRLHDCVVSSTREQKFQNINNRTESDTGFFRYFRPDFCTQTLATAALGCDPSSSTRLHWLQQLQNRLGRLVKFFVFSSLVCCGLGRMCEIGVFVHLVHQMGRIFIMSYFPHAPLDFNRIKRAKEMDKKSRVFGS